MLFQKRVIIIIITAFLSIPSSFTYAAKFQSPNVLVSTNNTFNEYTRDGVLVQSIPIPYPTGSYPGTEYARDVAADPEGNAFVYNGTFDPYLSQFDSVNNTWDHRTYSGWSTVNNISYGGIAYYKDNVYVTDMHTWGDNDQDTIMGIVKFNMKDSTVYRFAMSIEPIDLNIGQNGLLYALHPGGSPGGRIIDVYDPLTFDNLRTIDLTQTFGWTEHRTIAVDGSGDIYAADWDGDVQKLDANGNLIKTVNFKGFRFNDIDISQDGFLALGDSEGNVVIMDKDLTTLNQFRVSSDDIFLSSAFVSFVPTVTPEPASLALFGTGLIGMLARRRFRRS